MKCECGRDMQVETLRGDHGTIATAYKRLWCACGAVSEWCDVYFADWYQWACQHIKKAVAQ